MSLFLVVKWDGHVNIVKSLWGCHHELIYVTYNLPVLYCIVRPFKTYQARYILCTAIKVQLVSLNVTIVHTNDIT